MVSSEGVNSFYIVLTPNASIQLVEVAIELEMGLSVKIDRKIARSGFAYRLCCT